MNRVVVFFRRSAWLAFAAMLLVFHFNCSAAYTNGIYAEFNTSMGSYTCRLDYVFAPRTVANFIGLATGQRAWLDVVSGQVKTNPFFNGTIFHRVIPGFMNQGGSPNGQGTDGPGYQFTDEFTSLRHDGFGVLSSANSGPDSNGAQFFITVEPTPWLDDVHSIFGRLYGGSNVVYAINNVPTNGAAKPLTDVVLQSVVIQRVGSAAQNFDINAQSLPSVRNLPLKIGWAGTNLNVTFTNQLSADSRIYLSSNLLNWAAVPLGIEVASAGPTPLLDSPTAPSRFYKMAQIQYPPTIYTPRNVLNRNITLNFSSGPIAGSSVFLSLDNAGTGVYSWPAGGLLNAAAYNWIQDAYRGRFLPLVLNGFPAPALEVHMDFDSPTNGTFKGDFPQVTPPNNTFTGTFTASP